MVFIKGRHRAKWDRVHHAFLSKEGPVAKKEKKAGKNKSKKRK